MPELHHLGKIAYAAWKSALPGIGAPDWWYLSPEVQDAWQAAAVAARDDQPKPPSPGAPGVR